MFQKIQKDRLVKKFQSDNFAGGMYNIEENNNEVAEQYFKIRGMPVGGGGNKRIGGVGGNFSKSPS
jgi:hypothetical protein